MSEVFVLFDGYSKISSKDEIEANCSCALIKGQHNIIVDTMTSWDSERILEALKRHNVVPNMIHYVVSTHGHSDHIGNNNLFLQAKHIVGFSVSFGDKYFLHNFGTGERFIINDTVEVIPTPGHTLSDVSVIVKTAVGVVALTGDLFEKFEDVKNPSVWLEAGSEDPILQKKNRLAIAEIADWIIPGHGGKFRVTEDIKRMLREQALS